MLFTSRNSANFSAFFLIVLLYFCQLTISSAALSVDTHQLDVKTLNAKAKNVINKNKSMLTAPERYAGILPLDQNMSLTLLRTSKNKSGAHHRYQLTYMGLPVFGKHIIISENNLGVIKTLFGNLIRDIGPDLKNKFFDLSPQSALRIAKKHSVAAGLKKIKLSDESAKPYVYVDDNGLAHWVFIVTYFAETETGDQPMQPVVVVDASTGKIIDQWDEIMSLQIGTGPGGNQKTGLYQFGTDYGFLNVVPVDTTCWMRNSQIRTFNFKNAITGGIIHSYPCPQNTVKVTNGAFSPLNDAHFFGNATFAMYKSYVGKLPLPYQVSLKVHYGSNLSNAYWNNKDKAVVFGDGNINRYPWVSMDVVAHELSHGFTQVYSGLIYKDQSGGINEAFSDMAGEALEFYLKGKNDYKFGSEIVKGNYPIRNLAFPKLDGKSIDHASNYVKGMDVHYSSGIFNKAFTLLAKKPNWNIKKAFRVFAYANDLYWASDTTFNQAACGVEQAAIDLSYTVADVTSAFSAVGVGCGLIWDADSAIGFYGGPNPVFSDSKKTIASGAEPSDGMYGLASRTTVFRNRDKHYVEFTFIRQRSSKVFAHSGTICLSLRDKIRGVDAVAGGVGDWAICWFVDGDTTPVAIGPPWFYTHNDANVVIWGPPLTPGPLDKWRITEGDTIGIAVDLNVGKIWYSKNGVWVGDPANGSNPAFDQSNYSSTSHFSGKFLSPYLFAHFQELTVKIRGGATETLYPIPVGFSAWGG